MIYSAYVPICDYFWEKESIEEKYSKAKSISQLMKNIAQHTAGILHYLEDRLKFCWIKFFTVVVLIACKFVESTKNHKAKI